MGHAAAAAATAAAAAAAAAAARRGAECRLVARQHTTMKTRQVLHAVVTSSPARW